MAYTDEAGIWLEEYPAIPPTHVLNGEIFALFGLHDLIRVTGDERLRMLFRAVSARLAMTLARYEIGGWVSYDLAGRKRAAPDYYSLHTAQLEALGAITGDASLIERSQRWARVQEYAMTEAVKLALIRIYWSLVADARGYLAGATRQTAR